MNKIFKVKRNSNGQMTVCSEITKSQGKSKVVAAALAVAFSGVMASGVAGAHTITTAENLAGTVDNPYIARKSVVFGKNAESQNWMGHAFDSNYNYDGVVVIGNNAKQYRDDRELSTEGKPHFTRQLFNLIKKEQSAAQLKGARIDKQSLYEEYLGSNDYYTSNAVVIGTNAKTYGGGISIGTGVLSVESGLAMGHFATSLDGVAVGKYASATSSGVAIGVDSTASSHNSVALGNRAFANHEESVALGNYSATTREGGVVGGYLMTAVKDEGVRDYLAEYNRLLSEAIEVYKQEIRDNPKDYPGINPDDITPEFLIKNNISSLFMPTYESENLKQFEEDLILDSLQGFIPNQNHPMFGWVATRGDVSIGDKERGITRQLTNLAAGFEDTDAVNVLQLKAATNQIVEVLGGDAALENNGAVTMTNIGGTNKDTVDAAVAHVNTAIDTISKVTYAFNIANNENAASTDSGTADTWTTKAADTLTLGATADLSVTTDGAGKVVYGLSEATKQRINEAINSPKQVSNVTAEKGKGIVITPVTKTEGNVTTTTYTVALDDTIIADKRFVEEAIANIKMPEMPDVSGFITYEESVSSTNDNIDVNSDTKNTSGGKEFKLTLAKDLKGINSIGNDNSGIKFEAGAINVGGANISNVAAPTKDTDVANKKYVDDSRTVVTQGNDITVEKTTVNNTDTYKVALSTATKNAITKAQTDATTAKNQADTNKADITNLQNTKADKVALGAVRETADANKTAINTLIATKADKTYIDMLSSSMNNGFDAMYKNINIVENKLQAGIAGSNASASLPQVRGDGKSMMAFGLGGFQDKGAIAVGYSRSSDSGRTVFKAHLNADTEKQVGGGLGVGFEW